MTQRARSRRYPGLLSTAVGVLLVLLILPGGLASLVIRVRDRLVALIVVRSERADPTAPPGTVAPATRTVDEPSGVEERAPV